MGYHFDPLFWIHARHRSDEAARDRAALAEMPKVYSACEQCGRRPRTESSAYCQRCRSLVGLDDEDDRYRGGRDYFGEGE